jgi:protein phosphatase
MITVAGVATIPGLNHPFNEDRYRLLGGDVPVVRAAGRGHLYAVMDGVGSARKGMKSAQLLADALTRFYIEPAIEASVEGLCAIIASANREAHGWGVDPATGMQLAGAAFTVAWFEPAGNVHLFHCGDTAAFRFAGSEVERLTGEHARRGVLAHFLGQGTTFYMDVLSVPIAEGDLLCLVSDGVTKALSTGELGRLLEGNAPMATMARGICATARALGSADDITCAVVELEEW